MNWYECSPSTDNTCRDNTTDNDAYWGGFNSWCPPTEHERPPKLRDMREAMRRRDWAGRASDARRLAQFRSERMRTFNGLITG